MKYARFPSKQAIVLVLLGGIIGVAVWVIVTDAEIAFVTPVLEQFIEDTSILVFIAALAGILLLSVITRLITRSGDRVNRETIVSETPEQSAVGSVTSISDTKVVSMLNGGEWFDRPFTMAERQFAMYGRRSETMDEIPEELHVVCDELAVTARDVYATVHSCSDDEAVDAVRNGTWTNDRVAAAFLTSTIDADIDGFTVWERLTAWFLPNAVVSNNIERTVEAIEKESERAYLTYDVSTDASVGAGAKFSGPNESDVGALGDEA